MVKKITLIVLIIAWMVSIFLFSSQPRDQSAELSGGITDKVVSIIYSISKEKLDRNEIDLVVRKTAHFTLYSIGGILLFMLLNEYKIRLYKKILYSEGIGTLYAMTDEFHQIFVPGRGPLITDVLLDSIGVFTGIIVIFILTKIIYKNKVYLSQNSKSK